MKTSPSVRPGSRSAFSLIELLIVLTVLGVLFAVAAPNLFTLMQASSLSSEGSKLRNKLTYAQQLALSKNTDVEVRFFKMADAGAAEIEDEFRGFQFYQFDERGRLIPVSKFFRVQPPVVMSETYSTLLKPANNDDSEGMEYGFISPAESSDGEVPIGDEMVQAEYVSFRFRPDGSTDLPGRTGGDDTWYITLVQGDDQNGLPPNYYTIQVDPFNGRIGVFRP